ncbi:hypothetical protein LCGC14_1934070, partial [marine sediment metagenome]
IKNQYIIITVYRHIKSRCDNPNDKAYKWYGGKGVRCRISKEELKQLWIRDKAYLLKEPSIDRKNVKKNYTLDNCQFIEMEVNRIKNRHKAISQHFLDGKFIKEWTTIKEASSQLNIHDSAIVQNLKQRSKNCGGYIWRYANG